MPQRPKVLPRHALSGYATFATVFLASTAFAFKPNATGHLGITRDAVTSTSRTIGGKTLKFSSKALTQINEANKDTDCLRCQANASFHFDDEAFPAGTNRLLILKDRIIRALTLPCPDGVSARRDLGSALHSIQDFYAHSTWVDLGNSSIQNALGRSMLGSLPLSTATCPGPRGVLGGAGTSSLTSGYFQIPLCEPPAGKCIHGIPFECPDGLNKDDPSRPGFTPARSLALEASKDFINQVLDDSRLVGNARALKALMDIGGTLAMVIDDTGSMGPILDEVKSSAANIVTSVRGTVDVSVHRLRRRGPAERVTQGEETEQAVRAGGRRKPSSGTRGRCDSAA